MTKSFVFLNDLFTGAVKKLILIVLLYYAEVTMESFCSLDELVADAKKHFLVLIKFGTLENLKSLQNGSLYMKNLRYYNELESIDSDGKPDKYDGKWLLKGSSVVLMDSDTSALIAVGTAKETVLSFGHEKNPVFCLFSCDERNCSSGYKVDGNECVFSVSFSDERVEKLKKGLGPYALVILDPVEFFARIDKAFQRQSIIYKKDYVKYNDGNSVNRVGSIMTDWDNIAFNKSATDFDYQQEFRFLVLNRSVEDHLSIPIDDLHDITKIISTDELKQIRIEYRQEVTQVDG